MQIRISPDGLRSAAARQADIFKSISEDVSKIDSLSDQLAEAWEGASGTQAHNTLEQIKVSIKQILQSAEDSPRKLLSVAEAFESIDDGKAPLAIKLSTGLVPMPVVPTLFLSAPGMVRVDPDKVRDVAEQCKVVSASISENASIYAETVKNLSDDWEGKAYIKYEEESTEIIHVLREIEDNISVFIAKIVNAANRYEEIDNSL